MEQPPASTATAPGTPPLPWFTESYFSSDPATAAARKVYIKIISSITFLIIIFVLAALSIYWGALWKTPSHVHKLNGWIVDFDGAQVGQFVSRALLATNGPPTTITWSTVSPDQFPNGVQDIERAIVQEEKAWLILAISPNATNTLNAAVASADDSYVANRSVTVYAAEARSENAYRVIIHPAVESILDAITEAFNVQYIGGLPGRSSNLATLLANAPRLVSQPISYNVNNVRPFDVPVAAAVDFVGLIYLVILAFVATMAHYGARVDITHLQDRLTFKWLIIIRIVNPVIMYFFISLFYCLLSLAFQVPFNRHFGHSGFVIYWMMSWLAMCALGGAVESMLTLLTPRFIPFFLLLWIIVNVSVCFFPPVLLPGIYTYAYGVPFYNVQQTVRAIVFGSRNQIGLNFGVQFAWIVISCCTLTLFQFIKRRQSIREHEAAVAAANGAIQKP
ncbi:hypothetical protein BC834DRAFT_821175 [Gloeopeniophorella convolvens]|nr:hypothetical protein BC834DRAFT_821175 [Gloeopeniophorella convolvens]